MELWHVTRLALCLAMCGCGSSEPPRGDAGPDGGDGDGDGGIGIEPPALPVLTPCPEGWREVPPEDPSDPYGYATCDPWPDGDPVTPPLLTPCPPGWREVPPEDPTDPLGVATCDPWPVTGHEECEAVDEAHFPGEPGCTRIGSDCPEGDWADDLPADAPILYVRADEAEGGDGTRELPFATIADAMEAAEPGTVIALSKGTFDEAVLLDTGVTLWGACVAETLLTCSTWSEQRGTVTAGGPDTVLRNVRVSGERIGIWSSGRLPTIDVRDVVIEAARLGLLIATRATVVNVAVRDTRPPPGQVSGAAIVVAPGGEVEVSRAVFERNRGIGAFAFGLGAILRLTDVVVRDTQSGTPDGEVGLLVTEGAEVSASRAVFERNPEWGVRASGTGTILRLTEVVVRDTRSRQKDLTWGGGIILFEGARGEVSRAVVERNRHAGVRADDEGTTLELSDVLVRDTQSQESDGDGGYGMHVQSGARIAASRALLDRNRGAGANAIQEGTTLELSDFVVRDTLGSEDDGSGGRGMQVDRGAHVGVSRAVFERNRGFGIVASDERTTLTLTDVVVRDTESSENDGSSGFGLVLVWGARGEVNRAVLERNRSSAVVTQGDGTIAVLSDVVLRDTRDQQSDGWWGYGLNAGEGSQATLNRAVLERNTAVGAVAVGPSTSLVMVDTVVRDTIPGPDSDGGSGVVSVLGANVEMSRFLVTRNPLCGLQLAVWDHLFGTMDLHEGVVSDNEVCGVNVQDENFDIDRLQDRVIYLNNGTNLDMGMSIWVPEAQVPDLEPPAEQ